MQFALRGPFRGHCRHIEKQTIMTEIQIPYSDLKTTVSKTYSLVRKVVGNKESLKLTTAFYQDLNIYGTDWDCFLEEYEKEFQCQLPGLKYCEYFKEEVNTKDLFLVPLRIIAFPFFLFPKQSLVYKKVNEILFPIDDSKKRLTVGDLIVSAITKKFTKREEVKIKYAC